MNKSAISQEASNRFRAAASQYTHTAKLRASRLLTLKDDIAALRKRGISYRAISELLTQSGILASDTCVTNFCHRVLNEKHKSSAKRRASRHVNRDASPKHPIAPATAPLPPTPTRTPKPPTAPTETTSFTSRGPRIAKVEQLPPGETI